MLYVIPWDTSGVQPFTATIDRHQGTPSADNFYLKCYTQNLGKIRIHLIRKWCYLYRISLKLGY